MATATSLPCLVFHHGDDGKHSTTLYSVSDGARRPCEEMKEALRGKRSWVTSRGWLLVWDTATLATILWDPRTAKKIALPQWAAPAAAGTDCALSSDPTGPGDCFTVVVLEPFESESDDTALWYCHHAGGTSPPSPWTRHVYDLGGSWLSAPWGKFWTKRFVSDLTACGGKFHWPAAADKYGVLEFSPEPSLTTVTMAEPVEVAVPPGAGYAQAFKYSLDLDGEVHAAWIFFIGHEAEAVVNIAVYRVDIAGQRFVRVDSIGDRAVLAGGSSWPFAGWCPATEFGLLPNSVYWMHPYESRWPNCVHYASGNRRQAFTPMRVVIQRFGLAHMDTAHWHLDESVLEWWEKRSDMRNLERKAMAFLTMLVSWTIWNERNVRVFRQKSAPPPVLLKNVVNEANLGDGRC